MHSDFRKWTKESNWIEIFVSTHLFCSLSLSASDIDIELILPFSLTYSQKIFNCINRFLSKVVCGKPKKIKTKIRTNLKGFVDGCWNEEKNTHSNVCGYTVVVDMILISLMHSWFITEKRNGKRKASNVHTLALCIVHVCIASIYVSVGGESYASMNISSQSSPMNRSHPSEVFFAICIAQSLKPYFDIYTRRCATHTPEHAHETEFEGGFLFLLHIAN